MPAYRRERRELLVKAILFFIAASSSAPFQAWANEPRKNLRDLLKSTHLAPEIRELGRKYLELKPAEKDIDALVDMVLENVAPASDAEMSDQIANVIQSDFNSGRSVQVDRWFVATTEARIGALLHLWRES